MASIIHQATRPSPQQEQELDALTGNERSRHSSQRSRSGGFLRQLFCCFTGGRSNARRYQDTDNEEPNDNLNAENETPKVPPMVVEPQPDIVSTSKTSVTHHSGYPEKVFCM